ncbi:hypothetical protein CN326_08000 [Bacillus sp. AFS018417]|nr:hypothetical protein CN326_08000 [Bacillus sp. AFS018417]
MVQRLSKASLTKSFLDLYERMNEFFGIKENKNGQFLLYGMISLIIISFFIYY